MPHRKILDFKSLLKAVAKNPYARSVGEGKSDEKKLKCYITQYRIKTSQTPKLDKGHDHQIMMERLQVRKRAKNTQRPAKHTELVDKSKWLDHVDSASTVNNDVASPSNIKSAKSMLGINLSQASAIKLLMPENKPEWVYFNLFFWGKNEWTMKEKKKREVEEVREAKNTNRRKSLPGPRTKYKGIKPCGRRTFLTSCIWWLYDWLITQ